MLKGRGIPGFSNIKKLLQAYKIKEQGAYIGVPPKSNDTTT
jgi:hypothetical protein